MKRFREDIKNINFGSKTRTFLEGLHHLKHQKKNYYQPILTKQHYRQRDGWTDRAEFIGLSVRFGDPKS